MEEPGVRGTVQTASRKAEAKRASLGGVGGMRERGSGGLGDHSVDRK